jgi:hypothetical protein
MYKAITGEPLARRRNFTRRSRSGTGAAATASAASGSVNRARVRHLAKTGGWTRRERLLLMWYRLRLVVQEMNYASRRMVELQMRSPGQPLDQHRDRSRHAR